MPSVLAWLFRLCLIIVHRTTHSTRRKDPPHPRPPPLPSLLRAREGASGNLPVPRLVEENRGNQIREARERRRPDLRWSVEGNHSRCPGTRLRRRSSGDVKLSRWRGGGGRGRGRGFAHRSRRGCSSGRRAFQPQFQGVVALRRLPSVRIPPLISSVIHTVIVELLSAVSIVLFSPSVSACAAVLFLCAVRVRPVKMKHKKGSKWLEAVAGRVPPARKERQGVSGHLQTGQETYESARRDSNLSACPDDTCATGIRHQLGGPQAQRRHREGLRQNHVPPRMGGNPRTGAKKHVSGRAALTGVWNASRRSSATTRFHAVGIGKFNTHVCKYLACKPKKTSPTTPHRRCPPKFRGRRLSCLNMGSRVNQDRTNADTYAGK